MGMEAHPRQTDDIFLGLRPQEWVADLLTQPGMEYMTRSWRRKLAYLESKGAVAAIVSSEIEMGLTKQYETSDVQYRITHKGWQKVKTWFKDPLPEAEVAQQ